MICFCEIKFDHWTSLLSQTWYSNWEFYVRRQVWCDKKITFCLELVAVAPILLLLLLVVHNNTILLMVWLNAIGGKSSWLLYRATLLALLLAIDKRPTRFVVMAWNRKCDLMSQFFSNAVVEENTIGWYCHIAGQQRPGLSICCAPRQLLLYCGLCKICSGTYLAAESLRTVCASGTF